MRIFIASATADLQWVDDLRLLLATTEEPTWQALPPIGPHPDWQNHAREAIETSNALLFVTSSRSVGSPHCAWELATAQELGKPCYQWVVEAVSGPHVASWLPVLGTGASDDAPRWQFAS